MLKNNFYNIYVHCEYCGTEGELINTKHLYTPGKFRCVDKKECKKRSELKKLS